MDSAAADARRPAAAKHRLQRPLHV